MAAMNRLAFFPSASEALLVSTIDQAPEEICGLLAGVQQNDEAIIYEAILVENTLHSPTRFRMDPQGQILALNQIDEKGWELLGIFHSHPNGPAWPSETDLVDWYDPTLPSVICAREGASWLLRAFCLSGHEILEIPVSQFHSNSQRMQL